MLHRVNSFEPCGVHTNLQKVAATNTPIQGRKNTAFCVQEQQMLTELNSKHVKTTFRQESNSVFSVQSGICKV